MRGPLGSGGTARARRLPATAWRGLLAACGVVLLAALCAAPGLVREAGAASAAERDGPGVRLGGIDRLATELADGAALFAWFGRQAADPGLRQAWLGALWQVGLTLVLAAAAGIAAAMLVRAHRRRQIELVPEGWSDRLVVAVIRALLLLLPFAAFSGVAYAWMVVAVPGDLARVVSGAVVNAVALERAVAILARCVLSPLSRPLRALPLGDEPAAYLYVWIARFAAVGVYGWAAFDLLAAVGLPESGAGLLLRLVGLALTAMALAVVLQSRAAVASWIRGHPEGAGRLLRERLADIWHLPAMLAVLAIFVVWVLGADESVAVLTRGFAGTALALFAALLASAVLRRGLARLFRVGDAMRRRFPRLETRANRYVGIVSWVLHAVICLLAAAAVLETWGIGIVALLSTERGAAIVAGAVDMALVLVLAVVVWELGDGLIARTLGRADGDATLGPRVRTLLPLLSNALLVAVGSVTALTLMSELGIDIAPVLAAAGVVGLAVGFGAQTLVKDIVTGAFMLFEDQFAVGDWIDVGGKSGSVESVTIRTLRLRDFHGNVHTVPFGEIAVLTNYMREFGYALIDVGVAYRENTDEVVELLRRVDAEARDDSDLSERLTGDLEVMGVNELGDSAVTIRVRVRTLPGHQWGVRREYLRRIKMAFDRAGIEIPFPHLTVWFGETKGGAAPPPAHLRVDAGRRSPDSEAGEA